MFMPKVALRFSTIMILAINKFISKEFKHGFTYYGENITYYEAHYLMNSVAKWNGNQKKCFGYCFRDDNLTSHCMCNPSLMEDPNYTTLAGMMLSKSYRLQLF